LKKSIIHGAIYQIKTPDPLNEFMIACWPAVCAFINLGVARDMKFQPVESEGRILGQP